MDHRITSCSLSSAKRDHELMYNLYPSRADLEHPGKSIIGLGRHRSSYKNLFSLLFSFCYSLYTPIFFY